MATPEEIANKALEAVRHQLKLANLLYEPAKNKKVIFEDKLRKITIYLLEAKSLIIDHKGGGFFDSEFDDEENKLANFEKEVESLSTASGIDFNLVQQEEKAGKDKFTEHGETLSIFSNHLYGLLLSSDVVDHKLAVDQIENLKSLILEFKESKAVKLSKKPDKEFSASKISTTGF